MKADINIKTADFFSLAQSWYLSGVHTDISIRCACQNKPVFRCHRIIIREILKRELGTDISDLGAEVDELIIPDILHEQFEEYIRFLYGFDRDYKDKQFQHEVQINPLEIKVKIEEDNEVDDRRLETDLQTIDFDDVLRRKQEQAANISLVNIGNLLAGLPPHLNSQIQGIPIGGKESEKKCNFCQKVFKRHDHLTRHLLQHTGERPHSCSLCDKAFTRKDKLNQHYKKNHKERVFNCFCSKIFFDQLKYEQHIQANPDHYQDHAGQHNNNNNIEADCEEIPGDEELDHQYDEFISSDVLKEDDNQNESNVHFKTEVEELDMDMDMEESRLIVDPEAVIKSDHDLSFEDDKQDVKPKIIIKKKIKKKNENIENEDESGAYPCQYCDNHVFTSPKKRKEHYIGEHFDLLKESGLLFTHNKTVRIKVHTCPEEGCDRTFRHSCEVQDHVNVVHKKEKNYVCDLCSKAFPYKKSLRNHMDLKHDIHKKESILCPKCGDIFNSKAKLSAHVASKHKIRVAKFQCKFCDFKTHAKNVITEHERTHTGEKPEICQWCGKGFNAKKTLRNHERLHTGEKPYQCKLCNSSFAQRTSLNVHMNSHHKTDLPSDFKKDEKLYHYKHNNENTEDAAGGGQQQQLDDNRVKPEIANDYQQNQEGKASFMQDSISSVSSDPYHRSQQPLNSVLGTTHLQPAAGNLADGARSKLSDEAALISIKALNKLKSNDDENSSGSMPYGWIKE